MQLALHIDKDALLMELDVLNPQNYVQLIKELKQHAKHSQEVLMVFAIMWLEPQLQQLVLQEPALLIPPPPLMLLVQHGKILAFGLEQQDVKTPLLVLDLMEQLIHAQHLQEVMDHAQEQDQHQQLVFLTLQYVIKHLLHSLLMLNANHGMQFASPMDLDVSLQPQQPAI